MAQPAGVGNAVNQDLSSKVKVVSSILPIVGNNTTEGTGTAVDLKGYESATVVFHIGASGDTLSGSVYITPSIEESADGSTGWAAIPATGYRADVGTFAVVDAAAEDDTIMQVAVLAGTGRQRYIRAMLTFTGTHTNGTPISACVLKGHPRVSPATA